MTAGAFSGKSGRERIRWWCAAALITAAAAVLAIACGHGQRSIHRISVFDETSHVDYVVALRHGHVPRWGDKLAQTTMRIADCNPRPPTPPDCSSHRRAPTDFGAYGYDYEAQQPPLGYLPYLVVGHPHGPPRGALVSLRAGGAVWTVVAALLLLAVARLEELCLPGVAVLVASSLLSPVAVDASATVTNDSAGIAAGGLALLVASVARRRGRPTVALGLAAGVGIGLLKGTFLFAPLALTLAEVLRGAIRPGTRRSLATYRDAACPAAMLAGSVLAYVGWDLVQALRATVPAGQILHYLMSFAVKGHLPLSTLARSLEYAFSLFVGYSRAPVDWLWNGVFFAAVLAVLVNAAYTTRGSGLRAAAAGGVIALGVAGIGVPVLFFLQGHYNFLLGQRYVLSVIPVLALVVARGMNRMGLVALGMVAPFGAAAWQLAFQTM